MVPAMSKTAPAPANLPTIVASTHAYEAWLAGQIRLLPADLQAKHEAMADSVFPFLRATFYRWMQLYPVVCPAAAAAPKVLAVGDLHVENYGTWRDAEGRLVWGVNDFDEAYPLPYTVDLVRLATSALLALEALRSGCTTNEACAAIVDGYATGLAGVGDPFVLSERHPLLRDAVTSRARDPVAFWAKLGALPSATRVPPAVKWLLQSALPEPDLRFRVAHRRAGLGSLGRERFTALADWRGGKIARETKPLVPSAAVWAAGGADPQLYYSTILAGAVRAQDPFLTVQAGWVRRRLSPYCSRIELAQLARGHDRLKMLRAMGCELANIHLGSRRALPALRRDLAARPGKWLRAAAEAMAEATRQDWRAWRKSVTKT